MRMGNAPLGGALRHCDIVTSRARGLPEGATPPACGPATGRLRYHAPTQTIPFLVDMFCVVRGAMVTKQSHYRVRD